jgi:hypothetical protein
VLKLLQRRRNQGMHFMDIDLTAKLGGFVDRQESGPLTALQLFGIATR